MRNKDQIMLGNFFLYPLLFTHSLELNPGGFKHGRFREGRAFNSHKSAHTKNITVGYS